MVTEVDYPYKLNNPAIELNRDWMDPWFRSQLIVISERKGITLEESIRSLLGFYRHLEDVVEEEAFNLGLVKEVKREGTNLTVVAPGLPTYTVVFGLGPLIERYQREPESERVDLQQLFDKEVEHFYSQDRGKPKAEIDALFELCKIFWCTNYLNTTSYNWFAAFPIAISLYGLTITHSDELKRRFQGTEYFSKFIEKWVSATEINLLSSALVSISHERLSTLIGDEEVHSTDYDIQIGRRLAIKFRNLLAPYLK